jgi:pentatricopeptide repeat protein
MRRMEIEVTGKVFAAYISALSVQGKFEEARDVLEVMEKDSSLKLNMLMYVSLSFPHLTIYLLTLYNRLGKFYNCILSQHGKDLVEEWAKGLYPDV